MGCCQSRDAAEHDAPRPPGTTSITNPTTTSAAGGRTTSTPRNALSPTTTTSTTIRPSGPSTTQIPITSRPNAPIRSCSPPARSPAKVSHHLPPWTRKHLEREREAFFDTRVTGSAEIWAALRLVCDLLRKFEVAEAQGILTALNLTCPTGRIVRERGRHKERGGVFDERGVLYELPGWVVTDPEDIIEDSGLEKEEEEYDEGELGTSEDDEEYDADGITSASQRQQQLQRRREEKGKGRAEDPGELVVFTARLSHTGTDVVLNVGMKQKIAEIARLVQQQLGGGKRVRLVYLGQTLDERAALEQTLWMRGHVVNALVFEGEERG